LPFSILSLLIKLLFAAVRHTVLILRNASRVLIAANMARLETPGMLAKPAFPYGKEHGGFVRRQKLVARSIAIFAAVARKVMMAES